MLGDNIFYGHGLHEILHKAAQNSFLEASMFVETIEKRQGLKTNHLRLKFGGKYDT